MYRSNQQMDPLILILKINDTSFTITITDFAFKLKILELKDKEAVGGR